MDKETAFFHYFSFGILTFETVCLYYFDFFKMLVKKKHNKKLVHKLNSAHLTIPELWVWTISWVHLVAS